MSVEDESQRLERLQHWVQAVVTHPAGVAHGVASAEAQAVGLRPDLDALETVVAPSATLSGAERLAIYWRSYHARLLQCFREMFPALLHALGQELFDGFARDYLQRHPSRSYTLDRLADAFPQHLAETRPDAAAPPDERESWPDFIVELATLEWAFLKVYDGPGLEGR
ncbi:MAG TPA: DNA-binding domain-containing protein, partial [Pyrinomonadaceae bacterium]|nr:DNA-binding domain-containing protein [Pyrinomonadaceae bacterium]